MTAPRRYWIEFDRHESPDLWFWPGVGVTGFDVPDCLSMVADLIPANPLPPIRRITVDISLAEPLPVSGRYLGVPVWRGVWYPPRNLTTGPTHDIDRRGAPSDYPTPVADSRRVRRSRILRTEASWWDEIPHIGSLRWPLVDMHHAGERRGLGSDTALRDTCARDPTYGALVREALDYMIAWRPTPDEWFDPTETRFADQRELDEYLRAFRDYVFGTRPTPIDLPVPGA
ncbi:hypothetical protein [Nocardia aurantia]|uniref:Uncharacterized protein n=1 Tax=Nocardia aurantia TaxID=2585199 RepID=A0A7K0E3C2_9NOCA|nr:hypothetical protein [Nocardia aurantia]MQY31644.1 hypothetical protein [Nocardia aurantia]